MHVKITGLSVTWIPVKITGLSVTWIPVAELRMKKPSVLNTLVCLDVPSMNTFFLAVKESYRRESPYCIDLFIYILTL